MAANLNIVYEDKHMLVCNKPAGVLAQSNRSFDVDMVSAIMSYLRTKGEKPFAGVINRLDRPVSGLMVFGKTSEDTARLSRMLQQNTFNKQYYAVICGKPEQSKGTFVDYMLKDGKSNTSQIVGNGVSGAKKAELEYEVVDTITELINGEAREYSRVRIRLITGRHHQIRVQFASRGLPLVGDVKYADRASDEVVGGLGIRKNTIALCAYSLEIGNKKFQIEPESEVFTRFQII